MTPPDSRLEERVTGHLAGLVGTRLLSALYWPLNFELIDDLNGSCQHLGGEVELLFDRHAPLRITWDENAGHFSVQVISSSAFEPDSLVCMDVSDIPLWKPVIGGVITGVEVFGAGAPWVIVLRFAAGAVLVGIGHGNSHQARFGNGYDVIVMTEGEANVRGELKHMQSLWRTARRETD